jgi:hypothetical protein
MMPDLSGKINARFAGLAEYEKSRPGTDYSGRACCMNLAA